MRDITIGADPELFAFSKWTDNAISAHTFIPGTKHNPSKVPRGAIQVDGVAAEFNILPSRTQKEFIMNIRSVRGLLDRLVEKHSANVHLRADPVAVFDKGYFDDLPEKVKELGCEPDFNAYTMSVNNRPETDEPIRTGSGHVHIGWFPEGGHQRFDIGEEEHFSSCTNLVKQLDFVLGRSAHVWDSDTQRRKLYGAPGAFRPKSYGVEYRVLSNAWLRQEETQKFVFDAALHTTDRWLDGRGFEDINMDFENFDKYCAYLEAHKVPSIKSYKLVGHSEA